MQTNNIGVQTYRDDDWPTLWLIIRGIFRKGDTFSFAIDLTESVYKV